MSVERACLPKKIAISAPGFAGRKKDRGSSAGSKIRITRLLWPYWHLLAIAFAALLAEGAADLLEPWPLKIIFDKVIGSKRMPAAVTRIIEATVGLDKFAILEFAVLAVLAIAIIGAISTYVENT